MIFARYQALYYLLSLCLHLLEFLSLEFSSFKSIDFPHFVESQTRFLVLLRLLIELLLILSFQYWLRTIYCWAPFVINWWSISIDIWMFILVNVCCKLVHVIKASVATKSASSSNTCRWCWLWFAHNETIIADLSIFVIFLLLIFSDHHI